MIVAAALLIKHGYLSPIITVSNTNQNCSELAELSFDGFALSSGLYSFYDIIKVLRKIVYIDGQNFLYKVSEILVKHGLVNDKQELNIIDIRSLFEKLFPNEELEIRFFGVAKIKRRPDFGQEILDKSIKFSDNLRRFRNSLSKQDITYIEAGKFCVRSGPAKM